MDWRPVNGDERQLPTCFNYFAHPRPIGKDSHPPSYDPLYEFGHGLSDSDFEYTDVSLADDTVAPATFELIVGEETVVEIEQTREQRFGLRRLPQWFVARRHRDEALAAQGYSVRNRETNLSL